MRQALRCVSGGTPATARNRSANDVRDIADARANSSRLTDQDRHAMGLPDDNFQPIVDPDNDMKTPQQGAATTVFAATSPLLADIGGVYLQDNDIAPVEEGAMPVGHRHRGGTAAHHCRRHAVCRGSGVGATALGAQGETDGLS
jgi:hypothetical protein